MPPKNTIVINKLEQADVVRQLGGRTYFTVDDIKRLQAQNPAMIITLQQLVGQGRAYAVTDATPFVLCGTVGEMWTIKPDKLASTYMFLQNGQPLQINQQTLNQRMKNGVLDWTVIRTSPQATAGQNMACFVPTAQKGQIQTAWGSVLNLNGTGISHGKGDFIVCAKLPNGQPNLADRWVVNGEIFATTYNNQGWTQCLNLNVARTINIAELPKLVVNSESHPSASTFLSYITEDSLLQIGMAHILESVYDNLKSDSVTSKAEICHRFYNDTDTGFGGRSIPFIENNIKNSKLLTEKINPALLITDAITNIQQGNSKIQQDGLNFLVMLSYAVMTNATMKLFYNTDSSNVYLRKLWKNADCQYMIKNKITLCYYDSSEYKVCKDGVYVDFHIDGYRASFVRFWYGKSGDIDFRFLPKEPIPNINSSTKGFLPTSDKCSFLTFVKHVCDKYYSSIQSVANLDKYLLAIPENGIFKRVSMATMHLFKCISDDYNIKSAEKDGQYKFTYNIGGIERVIYLRDTDTGILVKSKLNSVEFNKTYKVSIRHSCSIIAMAIFTDICKLFKLHPAKSVFKSKAFWRDVVQNTNILLDANPYSYNYSSDTSKIHKIDIVGFNASDDTKYQLKVRFLDNVGNSVGERILVVDFNFTNFDISNARSRSYKALADLERDNVISKVTELYVALYYRNDSRDGVNVDNKDIASIDYDDTAMSLYCITGRLIETYKKYRN